LGLACESVWRRPRSLRLRSGIILARLATARDEVGISMAVGVRDTGSWAQHCMEFMTSGLQQTASSRLISYYSYDYAIACSCPLCFGLQSFRVLRQHAGSRLYWDREEKDELGGTIALSFLGSTTSHHKLNLYLVRSQQQAGYF
jgi:hypothetical protein